MGSLAPILAEFYMNHEENSHLKGSKFRNMTRHWTKYVDDVQIVWADAMG
jgi:hypothetical protein